VGQSANALGLLLDKDGIGIVMKKEEQWWHLNRKKIVDSLLM